MLARVGVGVMVKAGAPVPDVCTVDAFKHALLDAKTVSYIDPASGGSSGIYVANLLQKLGIADQIKPKQKLKQGGYVADLIKSGEAELGIHQISEIVPVKEVTLVGPLPAEIQNYTTYAAGVGATAKDSEAAKAMIKVLSGPPRPRCSRKRGWTGRRRETAHSLPGFEPAIHPSSQDDGCAGREVYTRAGRRPDPGARA